MGGVVEVAEIVEEVRTFCLSRKVRSRRKVRGPVVPVRPEGSGGTGRSGGRETGKNREVGIVDLGGKT